MAKFFKTWTVLQNGPIEKLDSNLWVVQGTMPNGRTQRVMTLARKKDGQLFVHNAIALDEERMKEIEAWGRPSLLVVPNPHHRQDAFIWKDRYRSMSVVSPRGIQKKVEEVVKVDMFYDDVPNEDGVELIEFEGTAKREGFMRIRGENDRHTLVFTDVLMNLKPAGFPTSLLFSPMGSLAVPLISRIGIVKDTLALKAQLTQLALEMRDDTRIIVAHGRRIETGGKQALTDAAARL